MSEKGDQLKQVVEKQAAAARQLADAMEAVVPKFIHHDDRDLVQNWAGTIRSIGDALTRAVEKYDDLRWYGGLLRRLAPYVLQGAATGAAVAGVGHVLADDQSIVQQVEVVVAGCDLIDEAINSAAGAPDLEGQPTRSADLAKRVDELDAEIAGLEARLANKGYVDRAPEHLVQESRDQLAAARDALAVLNHAELGPPVDEAAQQRQAEVASMIAGLRNRVSALEGESLRALEERFSELPPERQSVVVGRLYDLTFGPLSDGRDYSPDSFDEAIAGLTEHHQPGRRAQADLRLLLSSLSSSRTGQSLEEFGLSDGATVADWLTAAADDLRDSATMTSEESRSITSLVNGYLHDPNHDILRDILHYVAQLLPRVN